MYCSIYCFTGPKLKQTTCTEMKSGGYYAGDRQQVTGYVFTPQDCMTKCDQNNNCIAWTHLSSAQICWYQTSVTAWINDVSYTGGSCLRKSTKTILIIILLFLNNIDISN
ncbi:unnamed protein product [Rotaria sp. Silwood1]|nr:unnamed protein product [Rotaria sp. Silwood1]